MAVERFITLLGGIKKAVTALTQSSGVSDGGKVVATDPSTGKLHMSLMPSGLGAETDVMVAEAGGLSSGDIVNIYSDAGTLTARRADATTEGKEANGFVLGSVIAGGSATVYRPGQTISGLTGLTKGTMYYLSTTAGQPTDTPPNATGNVVQEIGKAMSDSTILFQPSEPITLA